MVEEIVVMATFNGRSINEPESVEFNFPEEGEPGNTRECMQGLILARWEHVKEIEFRKYADFFVFYPDGDNGVEWTKIPAKEIFPDYNIEQERYAKADEFYEKDYLTSFQIVDASDWNDIDLDSKSILARAIEYEDAGKLYIKELELKFKPNSSEIIRASFGGENIPL